MTGTGTTDNTSIDGRPLGARTTRPGGSATTLDTSPSWIILMEYVATTLFLFFQAEDGIRDYKVTGVQTCALPILVHAVALPSSPPGSVVLLVRDVTQARLVEQLRRDFVANASHELKTPVASMVALAEIGRASCRERV